MHKAALETEPKKTIPKKFADKLINDVRSAESKLRSFLQGNGLSTLPDRALPEPVADETTTTKRKRDDSSSLRPGGQATGLMAVPTFQNGVLVETVATKAHDLGLSKGAKVVVDKQEFVVTELTKDLMTVASIEEPKTVRPLKLEDMDKVELAGNEKKKKKEGKPPDDRMPGEAWEVVEKPDVEECLKHLVAAALFQIHSTSSPNRAVVRVHQETSGQKISLDCDVKKGQLALVPFALKYLKKGDKGTRQFSTVQIKYEIKSKNSSSMVLASGDGMKTLFWKLLGDEAHKPSGPTTLTWSTAKMEVPLRALPPPKSKDAGALCKASSAITVVVTFPYLTNTADLPARTMLTVPSGDPPVVAE